MFIARKFSIDSKFKTLKKIVNKKKNCIQFQYNTLYNISLSSQRVI